jgi:hypothetical protein
MGRILDLGSTILGLTYFGFVEMNPIAFTTLGWGLWLAGFASLLLAEYLSAKLGKKYQLVVFTLAFSASWFGGLWNLANIVLWIK